MVSGECGSVVSAWRQRCIRQLRTYTPARPSSPHPAMHKAGYEGVSSFVVRSVELKTVKPRSRATENGGGGELSSSSLAPMTPSPLHRPDNTKNMTI
jgi:hypothetical protein